MVKNTDCHFGGRVRISSFTIKCYKTDKQSAISDHLLECSTDFDDFDILTSNANRFRLYIKEVLFIKRDKLRLNKIIKPFPLSFQLVFHCTQECG